GRLLVMDRDKGTIYFREYICAIILLTLLFAGAAQDVSHQELAEQLQFDRGAGELEQAGRLAVGEGNPVGYSAAINTAASAVISLFCAALIARGTVRIFIKVLAGMSSGLLFVVALNAGTRGLIIALFVVCASVSVLSAMRGKSLSNRITVCLLAAA